MTSFQTKRKQRGFVDWTISLLVLLLATFLPSLAVAKAMQGVNYKYTIAYLAGISAATAFAYWSDKKKAEAASWRTSEMTLHLLELFGGWTAAFVSQRLFRHKITKLKYQFAFWLICVFHQYLSFDYLNQWRYITYFHRIAEHLPK